MGVCQANGPEAPTPNPSLKGGEFMTQTLTLTTPLIRWQGERGTYHLVTITGGEAETIATHERLHRLEFGSRRGFGSVKVRARVGGSGWKSSVFPSRDGNWFLLISAKLRKAEQLEVGEDVTVELELL